MEQEQLKTITDAITDLTYIGRLTSDIISEDDIYKLKNIFPIFRKTLTKKEYDSIQKTIRDSIILDYRDIQRRLDNILTDARHYTCETLKNNKLSEELLKENQQQEIFLSTRADILREKEERLNETELNVQEKEKELKQELIDEKNKNTKKQDELENELKLSRNENKLQKEFYEKEIESLKNIISAQGETIEYYRGIKDKDPVIVSPQIVQAQVIQSDLHNNIVK